MAKVARIAEVRAEHLLTELLAAQGWNTARPPRGDLLRQHEYKDYPHLLAIFKGNSKSGGGGEGLPEAVLIDDSQQPLAVVEVKASISELEQAISEVTLSYGKWCIEAGFTPLAVALAGTSEDDFKLRVFKWSGSKWLAVTYDGNPIGWIPNRADIENLRAPGNFHELRPSVPPQDVLSKRADEINRLLREAKITDAHRPAVVGAIMLALWQSRGNIRRDPQHILGDIKEAANKAFWKAGKGTIADSLTVPVANKPLAIRARRIVNILERLNVTVLTAETDYLGELYETFFSYVGGNTIGQIFTPRHMTAFMAELTEIGRDDVVLDPACGTGGFLIAAMNRMQRSGKLSRSEVVKLVRKRLIGFDTEPTTAALCIANMILRGDGSTSVHEGDSFSSSSFPLGKATVVLMNPPFPHKKTDVPPELFVDRALDGLSHKGLLAAIVPQSLLVKIDKRAWREGILEKHTVEGVIVLPDHTFQPFANAFAAIILLRKGVPHTASHPIFFARIEHDGFAIRKNMRVQTGPEQLSAALAAYRNKGRVPRLCGWAPLSSSRDATWSPSVHIPAITMTGGEISSEVATLARARATFVVGHARELCLLLEAVKSGALKPKPYRQMRGLPPATLPSKKSTTLGDFFDMKHGQHELHSKAGLTPGRTLIISSSDQNNGCYGFREFNKPIAPPFVTVAANGNVGAAFVAEWPCGVSDTDCLILLPKVGVPHELLYVAAAVVRHERWRFGYGSKITAERIAWLPIPSDEATLAIVRAHLGSAARIESVAFAEAAEELEDEADAVVGLRRIVEIERDSSTLIGGDELKATLDELLS